MDLSKWTIALCVDCGFPVVGAHDCERQNAENGMSEFQRAYFYYARGEMIAQMALARAKR